MAENDTGFLRSSSPCAAVRRTPLFAGFLGGVSGSAAAPPSPSPCHCGPSRYSAEARPTSRRCARGFDGLSLRSCARRDSRSDSACPPFLPALRIDGPSLPQGDMPSLLHLRGRNCTCTAMKLSKIHDLMLSIPSRPVGSRGFRETDRTCSRLFGAAVGTNSPVVDRSLAPLARITDLDEWLALLQAGSGFWKARA